MQGIFSACKYPSCSLRKPPWNPQATPKQGSFIVNRSVQINFSPNKTKPASRTYAGRSVSLQVTSARSTRQLPGSSEYRKAACFYFQLRPGTGTSGKLWRAWERWDCSHSKIYRSAKKFTGLHREIDFQTCPEDWSCWRKAGSSQLYNLLPVESCQSLRLLPFRVWWKMKRSIRKCN